MKSYKMRAAVVACLAAAAGVKVYPSAVGLLVGLVSPRRVWPWIVAGCVGCIALPFVSKNPPVFPTVILEIPQKRNAGR